MPLRSSLGKDGGSSQLEHVLHILGHMAETLLMKLQWLVVCLVLTHMQTLPVILEEFKSQQRVSTISWGS